MILMLEHYLFIAIRSHSIGGIPVNQQRRNWLEHAWVWNWLVKSILGLDTREEKLDCQALNLNTKDFNQSRIENEIEKIIFIDHDYASLSNIYSVGAWNG